MVVILDKYRQTRDISLSLPIGEEIALARKNQGMSQERLGEAVGYSQSIISRIETGSIDVTPAVMAAIVMALNNLSLRARYCSGCPMSAVKTKIRHEAA